MNRNVLPDQGEMAEKIGITRTSLCLYENGQRTPGVHVLKRFILASGKHSYSHVLSMMLESDVLGND